MNAKLPLPLSHTSWLCIVAPLFIVAIALIDVVYFSGEEFHLSSHVTWGGEAGTNN